MGGDVERRRMEEGHSGEDRASDFDLKSRHVIVLL